MFWIWDLLAGLRFIQFNAVRKRGEEERRGGDRTRDDEDFEGLDAERWKRKPCALWWMIEVFTPSIMSIALLINVHASVSTNSSMTVFRFIDVWTVVKIFQNLKFRQRHQSRQSYRRDFGPNVRRAVYDSQFFNFTIDGYFQRHNWFWLNHETIKFLYHVVTIKANILEILYRC